MRDDTAADGSSPCDRRRDRASSAAEDVRDVKRSRKAAWESTNTVFTNEKGGMTGYDKDKVKKIVYEMSKDSPHFRNEQRKQQHSEAKIKRLQEQSRRVSKHELAGHVRKMDVKISALLAEQDLSRTWIHVDLDAFFASVEELSDPSLKTKPVGVGGLGMLSTANYVARKFGIRAAMPGFIAKRLCPELVFVRPDFRKYSEASHAVRTVLAQYDESLEAGSLDEAYLDVTDYCAAHCMSGPEVAAEIRAKVLQDTQLTCSCGVAPNTMLAKVCSDINKPNGQFSLAANSVEIRKFLDGLSVRKVPGVGKVGEQELGALGVVKCSDLIAQRGLLSALLSDVAVDTLIGAGLGLGRTRHHAALKDGEVGRKGMSVERTFSPIQTTQDLETKCCELAGKLAADMESEDLQGKTLTLKLKPPTFEVRTRAVTLPAFISSEADIRAAALRLLHAELPIQVRLMGLRMSNFYQVQLPMGQKSLASFFKPKGPGLTEEKMEEEPGSGDESEEGQNRTSDPDDQQEAIQGAPHHDAPHKSNGRGARGVWVCQMCTFAENPWQILRCLICDQRRGCSLAAEAPSEDGLRGSSSTAQAMPAVPTGTASQGIQNRESDAREGEYIGGKKMPCTRCGKMLAEAEMQEHQDHHLAWDLHAGSAPCKPAPASTKHSSGVARQSCALPITKFFRRAET